MTPSESLKPFSIEDAQNLPPLQFVGMPTQNDYANGLQERLPPIKTCGQKWYVYNDGAYREMSRDVFRPCAQNVYPPSIRTDRRARALLDDIEGRCQVPQEKLLGAVTAYDSGALLINALNGVIRVTTTTADLLPHSPRWNFTRSLDSIYDPAVKSPLFDGILSQSLPDQADRTLFQLFTGNILLPDCRFEVALNCFGEGGTGKSTLGDTIKSTIGDDVTACLSMSQICDPKSYSLPEFRHALVNLGTELDSLAVDESGNFKKIVSGEAIEVRPIYGQPFTMRTHTKLWFLSNSMPRFKNGTDAELRRMRFIRFDQKPGKIDVTLKARLLREKSGVLNFMIDGLQNLLSLDAMPIGGTASREVHERFRVSNDPIGVFVHECCELNPEARIRKESLLNAFGEFCANHNLNPELQGSFLKKIYERLPAIKSIKARDGEERVPTLTGIQLQTCKTLS